MLIRSNGPSFNLWRNRRVSGYVFLHHLGEKFHQITSQGTEKMGESIGEVIGYFIPDLLLVVFSEGISELIEGALKSVLVVLKGSEIGKLALEAVRVADVAVEALRVFVEKADIFLDTKYAELKEELLKIIELIKEWLGIEKEGAEAGRTASRHANPEQFSEFTDYTPEGKEIYPGDKSLPQKRILNKKGEEIIRSGEALLEYKINGKVVGYAQLEGDNLTLAFEVMEKNTGTGKAMFEDALKVFGDKVKAIKGSWNKGDNFDEFVKALEGGKSKTEAAYSTFTGEMARRNGFRIINAEDVVIAKNAAGKITNITPLFRK